LNDSPLTDCCHKIIRQQLLGGVFMYNQVPNNRVPNLNHYPINTQDERFGFLPFVGGLAVGALAGGFGGGRPCGPACGPMYGPPMQVMPMPMPTPQFVPIPVQTLPATLPPNMQFQNMAPGGVVQGPILESNKFYMR